MKNLTVSLDDETYRRARIVAAQRDKSVSALVREFLSGLSAEDEIDQLKRREKELRAGITAFRASDRLSRDEVHERRH